MGKIDDAAEAIQENSQYIEPEEFFSNPPSKETIKQWTESLSGFEAQVTISAEAEADLDEIRQLYSANEDALEQHAADLGVQPIDQSSPKEVLYMAYIRILQSRYAPKKNLNTHKFENLRDRDYSIEDKDSEDSTPENEPTRELSPGPLREIDPTRRNIPEDEENVSYESSKKAQAEATNVHEQTVEAVSSWLEAGGWNCRETEETDILATRDGQVLVAEVKSIDGQNDDRQIRKALGQLHENCYRDVVQRGWDDRTLIASLVLSQRPRDQYLGYFEYLRGRDIETLWTEKDEVKGLPKSVDRIS